MMMGRVVGDGNVMCGLCKGLAHVEVMSLMTMCLCDEILLRRTKRTARRVALLAPTCIRAYTIFGTGGSHGVQRGEWMLPGRAHEARMRGCNGAAATARRSSSNKTFTAARVAAV